MHAKKKGRTQGRPFNHDLGVAGPSAAAKSLLPPAFAGWLVRLFGNVLDDRFLRLPLVGTDRLGRRSLLTRAFDVRRDYGFGARGCDSGFLPVVITHVCAGIATVCRVGSLDGITITPPLVRRFGRGNAML